MATMTIRTTVSFDPPTAARLEWLAKRWGVSKSEALRRALKAVEEQELAGSRGDPGDVPDPETMTPLEILDWLGKHPLVTPEEGEKWRCERRALREDVGDRAEPTRDSPAP